MTTTETQYAILWGNDTHPPRWAFLTTDPDDPRLRAALTDEYVQHLEPRLVTRQVTYTDWTPVVAHEFVPGGPKVDGKITPRPACTCGATMPTNIKTSPAGWFRSHTLEGRP